MLVESYLTFMTEEQNRVGLPVEHAVPMLADMLTQLLQDMRVRAQLVSSVPDRIAITRVIALYPLTFRS